VLSRTGSELELLSAQMTAGQAPALRVTAPVSDMFANVSAGAGPICWLVAATW
jgi:hypothetical protein